MEVHIGDRIADIELLEKNGNNVQVSIDGEVFNVDMTMTDNGSCSILHNGKSYNMEVLRSENGKNYKMCGCWKVYTDEKRKNMVMGEKT